MTGQVIGGRLVVLPRPAPPHVNAAGAIDKQIGAPYQFGVGGPGGWWILPEPELELGIEPDFEVIDPDLAGWRRTRMPHLPESASFPLAPDWVCEVLSPSTKVHDRGEKMPFYARVGVGHGWIVDPIECTLEVFRNDAGVFRPISTHRGDVTVRVEPFDAVELNLAYLWAR